MSDIRDEADQHYKAEQRTAYEKLNEEKYNAENAYNGAKKYKYKTPTPAPTQTPEEMAERDIPTVTINGAIFEATRVINVNLAHSMVEMIDKHGNKYRLDAVEVLKMAKEKEFIATTKKMKGNTYHYLTLKP